MSRHVEIWMRARPEDDPSSVLPTTDGEVDEDDVTVLMDEAESRTASEAVVLDPPAETTPHPDDGDPEEAQMSPLSAFLLGVFVTLLFVATVGATIAIAVVNGAAG